MSIFGAKILIFIQLKIRSHSEILNFRAKIDTADMLVQMQYYHILARKLLFFQLESPELYFGHPSYKSNLLRLLIK